MSQLQTRIHVKDGQMIVQNTQDCTAIAERTKEMHNAGHHGTSELKFAASIPEVFINDYLYRTGITLGEFCRNPEHARFMLNDPALAHFRVWKGRI